MGLIIVGTGNIGTGSAGPDGSVDQYLTYPTGTWTQILPVPVNGVSGPNWLASAIQDPVTGKFFLFGNTDAQSICATYDPSTNTYAALTSLPSGCFGAGCATMLNGKVYCIGGQSKPGGVFSGAKTVFSYLLSQGNSGSYVTSYTNLTTGLTSAAAATVGSTIYFGGGDDENATGPQSAWYSWDGASSTYTSLTAMPGNLAAASAVTLTNGVILLIGGYALATGASVSTIYAYNTTSTTKTIGSTSISSHAWATLPAFPIAISFANSCLWNGGIYVVGGIPANGSLRGNVVYTSFDNGNSWSALTNNNVQSIAGSVMGVYPIQKNNSLLFASD
jgi:N-acetylneuraminic acid mutarotase